MKRLVLASASPYRAAMLRELGYDFTIHQTDIEEVWPHHLSPATGTMNLAERKAAAAHARFPRSCVLAADTIVVNARGRVLLKPGSAEEALSFLRQRSDATEEIITGFCLRYDDRLHLSRERSFIRYRTIPSQIQESIIRSNEWRDVCGGLKIEGMIAPYIDEMHGSRNNIMGLPTEKIVPLLDRLGITRSRSP